MRSRALSAAIVAATLTVAPALNPRANVLTARPAAAAASAQPVAPDVGFTIEGGRDFVGSYRTTSGPVIVLYCPNPRAGAPRYIRATATDRLRIYDSGGRIVTIGTVMQWRLAYLLATFGNVLGHGSSDRVRAAAVSQAMNTLLGNLADVHRRAASLPSAVARLTAQYLARTTSYAGPYRIRFGVHPALAVGQSYRTSVSLVAHSGAAVPAQRFTLRATGVAVPPSVVADGRGHAWFRYQATSPGAVSVTAIAGNIPTASVLAGALTRNVQRLIGAGRRGEARAAFSFRRAIAPAAVRYACRTMCDGRPAEDVVDCTAGGTAPALFTVFDDGVAVGSVTTRASSVRQCVTAQVRVPDTHRLAVTVRYLVGGRWTSAVPVGSPVAIDCPPPPVVLVRETCNCRDGVLLATLTNSTDHLEAIVVNGAFTATQDGVPVSTVVAPGHTLTLRFGYQRGSSLDVTVAGAAQRRTSVDWNTGVGVRTVVSQ